MRWKKTGLVFKPGGFSWMLTHAQSPFVESIQNGVCKVHFVGHDQYNQSRGGWARLDMENSFNVVEVSQEPTLDLGDIGCFDDCGAMPSCIIANDDVKYMYYTGWSRAVKTPFTLFVGLAVSHDSGKTFRKYSKAPILGRSDYDPYLTASPWVLRENGVFRMWYVSGVKWERVPDAVQPRHYYHIRHAESDDGIEWKGTRTVCIDFEEGEYAIARPVVYKDTNIYKMWYSYRGDSYRIGYAESRDGLTWLRKDDEAGIGVSGQGDWDSEMVCYPYVFGYRTKEYMLYNGNSFGKMGFGLALLESPRALTE